MPDTQTDLVIQISTSQPASSAAGPNVEDGEKNKLIGEIRQCFRPGAEIVLILGGCTAITSILWLSELQQDGCFRAGIRLLGVSALPAEQREPTAPWAEAPRRALPVQSDSAIIRQQS